jgi:hypothetical protein
MQLSAQWVSAAGWDAYLASTAGALVVPRVELPLLQVPPQVPPHVPPPQVLLQPQPPSTSPQPISVLQPPLRPGSSLSGDAPACCDTPGCCCVCAPQHGEQPAASAASSNACLATATSNERLRNQAGGGGDPVNSRTCKGPSGANPAAGIIPITSSGRHGDSGMYPAGETYYARDPSVLSAAGGRRSKALQAAAAAAAAALLRCRTEAPGESAGIQALDAAGMVAAALCRTATHACMHNSCCIV